MKRSIVWIGALAALVSGLANATEAEVRKKFGGLPLSKKLATLMQLEAITMSEAFDSAIEKPLQFGSKTFDALMNRARAKNANAKMKK